MTQNTMKLVRTSIFTVTATLAALIVSLPSGAMETSTQQKLGAFAGLMNAETYNPEITVAGERGDRYRLNPAFRPQPELQPRTILSVSFDQKNLLPVTAGLSHGLKKRKDIAFDRNRSLLADFRLGNPK